MSKFIIFVLALNVGTGRSGLLVGPLSQPKDLAFISRSSWSCRMSVH